MLRAIAFLILGLVGLAAPAMACSTSGSSTFCSDGWLSQPVTATRGRDEAADANYAEDQPYPEGQGNPAGPDDIYVDGAVTISDDGSDDGGL